ncbi:MAG: sugar phosphate nucleotidyltransferase [Weeksellaceae bacterium]
MGKPLVILLAGGVGKNFAPLIVNKTLVPFCGKPVLQHMIETIEQSGFHEVLIVTNHENEQWLESYQPFNITIETHIQDEPLGMADALLKIESKIKGRPILVMNAVDMINPTFFKQMYQLSLDVYSFVVAKEIDSYFPGGYVKVEGNKAIGIVEKPEPGTEPSKLLNLVFHYYSDPTEFFPYLRAASSLKDDHYEQALNRFMQEKEVRCLTYQDYWQKLKYAYHVLDVMDIFLQNRVKSHRATTAYVSPHAIIEGNVFIDEYAHIDAGAIIKGPAYIGKNVKVGNHSLVRQSMIEEGSVIGFGSEVARSYVGPRSMLHHNFLGDTIFESDINPSWGTTFANFRLDNKPVIFKRHDTSLQTTRAKLGAVVANGVFFGVNCSVMPGIAIGARSKIFPQTTVFSPVTADETVKNSK